MLPCAVYFEIYFEYSGLNITRIQFVYRIIAYCSKLNFILFFFVLQSCLKIVFLGVALCKHFDKTSDVPELLRSLMCKVCKVKLSLLLEYFTESYLFMNYDVLIMF